MNAEDTQRLSDRKVRIDDRLDGRRQWESDHPVVENTNLHYDGASRVSATSIGGIGLVHEFVRELGLVDAIDRNVSVFKHMRVQGAEIRRMEFRRFLSSIIHQPCQLVRTARRTVLRILAYSPWAQVLIDGTAYFRAQRRLA